MSLGAEIQGTIRPHISLQKFLILPPRMVYLTGSIFGKLAGLLNSSWSDWIYQVSGRHGGIIWGLAYSRGSNRPQRFVQVWNANESSLAPSADSLVAFPYNASVKSTRPISAPLKTTVQSTIRCIAPGLSLVALSYCDPLWAPARE